MAGMLPLYDGALKKSLEKWSAEYSEEFKDVESTERAAPPVTPTIEQLKSDPRLGPAPAAGQMVPIFDIRQV